MTWLNGWRRRQKICIDHRNIEENLINFPVKMIMPSTCDIFNNSKIDGSDIRFTSSDGTTLLNYEKELYNPYKSLYFNGSTDYAGTHEFSLGTDPVFSVEGWFKITDSNKGKSLWGIGSAGALTAISAYQNLEDNKIGIDLYGNTTYCTDEYINIGEYNHLVWVKKTSGPLTVDNIEIYINGNKCTLITIRNNAGTPNLGNGLVLAGVAYNEINYRCSCYISNFRVWDKALTHEEIQYNMNHDLIGDESNLVVYYKMEENDTKFNDTEFKIYAYDYPEKYYGIYNMKNERICSTSRDWHIIIWNREENRWMTKYEINFNSPVAVYNDICARYDTYDAAVRTTQQNAFISTLNSLDSRYIVVIIASHAPENFSAGMVTAIKRCGGTDANLSWVGTRKSYICVGVPGCGTGNAISEVLDNEIDYNNSDTLYAKTVVNLHNIVDRTNNYDIVLHASTGWINKTSIHHVKIPSISSIEDTYIYMYYDNPSATDVSSPADVWDSNYKLVMHMNDSLKDSTSNNNDGTNNGTTLGLASDGYYRRFDGVDDYVYIPHSFTFSSITLEFCLDWDKLGTSEIDFIIEGQEPEYFMCHLGGGAGVNGIRFSLNSTGVFFDTVGIIQSGMNHYAITYDGSTAVIYRNGSLIHSLSVSWDPVNLTLLALGKRYNGDPFYLNGDLSEVRIWNTASSAAWIKATSLSLNNNLIEFDFSDYTQIKTHNFIENKTNDFETGVLNNVEAVEDSLRIKKNNVIYRCDFENIGTWKDTGSSDSSLIITFNGGGYKNSVLNATNEIWYYDDILIPYDSTKLYEISGRVRQVLGNTNNNIYIGIEGIASDGITMINYDGTNTHSSQYYIACSSYALKIEEGWKTFRGYFKGFGSPFYGAHDPLNPTPLNSGVTYIRPLFIGNYDNGTGTIELDYIEIKEITNNINYALNKTSINGSQPISSSNLITDGNRAYASYTSSNGTYNQFLVLDLEDTIDANHIGIWHYYGDSRIFKKTKTQIASDLYNVHDTPSAYLDYTSWVVGSSGSQGIFSMNGAAPENLIVDYVDPFGKTTPTWQCVPDAASDGDGGWNASFTCDNTKTFLFSVFVKKIGGVEGYTYIGCSSTNTLNLAGTANTNPYFWAGALPTLEEWYLLVGILHSNSYSGSDTTLSGVYNMQGKQLITGTDFKCGASNTQTLRNYLFYCTNTAVRQYFVYPRITVIDDATKIHSYIFDLLNGIQWNTIFDSKYSGEYAESSVGKWHSFENQKVRYIRDFINGSNLNTGNHWCEIEVYGTDEYLENSYKQTEQIDLNKLGDIVSGKLKWFYYGFGNGSDLNKVVSIENEIINKYTHLVSSPNKNDTTITVNNSSLFSINQEIMIYQTQHSTNAGYFEYKKIINIDGNVIYLDKPLERNYATGRFNMDSYAESVQIVSVPNYLNLTINSNCSITAKSWDGYSGGVVVFRVKEVFTNNGKINTTGKGYRGGRAPGVDGYSHIDGECGEGFSRTFLKGFYDSGNVAEATDNGGTTYVNGSGGSNFSKGDAGSLYGIQHSPGIEIKNISPFRAIFGGGGGGGHNNAGLPCGGNGGGLIIIYSPSVNGILESRGNSGFFYNNVVGLWGSGGGAGGTVVVNTYSNDSKILVSGGIAANGTYTSSTLGDGGDGGSGVCIVNNPIFKYSIDNGLSWNLCSNDEYMLDISSANIIEFKYEIDFTLSSVSPVIKYVELEIKSRLETVMLMFNF